MLLSKPSRRYAAALHQQAKTDGCLDGVMSDMASLERFLEQCPELAALMHDYGMARSRRLSILRDLFQSRVNPLTWRFLTLLDEKRRLGALEDICVALRAIHREEAGISQVQLACAYEPDTEDVRLLSESIRRMTGGPIDLMVSVRPSLLGGFRVRIGDMVYDLSIEGALRDAKHRMINA